MAAFLILGILFLVFVVVPTVAFQLGRWTANTPSAPWQSVLQMLASLHAAGRIDDHAYDTIRRAVVAKLRAAGHTGHVPEHPHARPLPPQPNAPSANQPTDLPTPPSFAAADADLIGAEIVDAELVETELADEGSPNSIAAQRRSPSTIEAQASEPLELELDLDLDVSRDSGVDSPQAESDSPQAEPVGDAIRYLPPETTTPPRRAGSTKPETPAPWDFPDEPRQPAAPQRTWGELLQAFMEDKNIRWGELLSGMLIIGSATGLVLSLREPLQETIPYFPSLMFLLLIGMVHAAGLYTHRRWKLETTSRGVLTIGTLLIPLGLLAACLLSAKGEVRAVTDPTYVLAVVVGLSSYTYLAFRSSNVLMAYRASATGEDSDAVDSNTVDSEALDNSELEAEAAAQSAWADDSRRRTGNAVATTVSVIGASASILAVHRLTDVELPVASVALGAAPVLFAMLAPLSQLLLGNKDDEPWDDNQAERFALSLSLPGFAAIVALVYWQHKLGGLLAVGAIAGPVVGLGCSLLSIAGIAWQTRSESVRWKLTGAVTALTSLIFVIAAHALAWPSYPALLATGLDCTLAFGAAAFVLRSPLAASGALATLAPTWVLTTLHWLAAQPLEPLLTSNPSEVLLQASTAWSLAALGAAIGAVAGIAASQTARADHREPFAFNNVFAVGAATAGGLAWLIALLSTLDDGSTWDFTTSGIISSLYGLAAILAPGLGWTRVSKGSAAAESVPSNATIAPTELTASNSDNASANMSGGLALVGSLLVGIGIFQMAYAYPCSIGGWQPPFAMVGMFVLAVGLTAVQACYPLLDRTDGPNGVGCEVRATLSAVANAVTMPLVLSAIFWTGVPNWAAAASWWIAAFVWGANLCTRPRIQGATGAWLATEWLTIGAVFWTTLSVVDARTEWTSLLDGVVFQPLIFCTCIWAAGLGWQQQRLRRVLKLEPLDSQDASQDVPAFALTFLVILTCVHVTLVGAMHWGATHLDTVLGGAVSQLPTLAILNLAMLTVILLVRNFTQTRVEGIVGLGLLSTALIARIVFTLPQPWVVLPWALAAWLMAFAVAVRFRTALTDRLRSWVRRTEEHTFWHGDGARRLELAIGSVAVPVCSVVLAITARHWWHTDPTLAQSWSQSMLDSGPLLLCALSMMLLCAATLLPIFAWLGGALATIVCCLVSSGMHTQHGTPEFAGFLFINLGVGWSAWGWAWWAGTRRPLLLPTDSPQSPQLERQRRHWSVLATAPLMIGVVAQLVSVGCYPIRSAALVSELLTAPNVWWLAPLSLALAWLTWGPVVSSGLDKAATGAQSSVKSRRLLLILATIVTLCSLAIGMIDVGDTGRQWHANYTLHVVVGVVGLLAAAGATFAVRTHQDVQAKKVFATVALAFIGCSYGLSLQAAFEGPGGANWGIASCLAGIFSALTLSFGARLRGMSWLSMAQAATVAAIATENALWSWTTVLATAIAWALAHIHQLRSADGNVSQSHRWVAGWSIAASAPLALVHGLLAALSPRTIGTGPYSAELTAIVLTQLGLTIVCLWDRRCSRRLGQMFFAGLATVLACVPMAADEPRVWPAVVLAGWAFWLVAATRIWCQRTWWNHWLAKLGSPPTTELDGNAWLRPTVIALSAALTVAAMLLIPQPAERWTRFLVAFLPLLSAVAMGQLVNGTKSDASNQQSGLRLGTLTMASLGMLFVSWADIYGEQSVSALAPDAWLERLVRSVSVFAIVSIVYGALAPRVLKGSAWVHACRRMFTATFALSLGLFLLLLGCEWWQFVPQEGAPIPLVDVVSVSVIVAMLAAALTLIALTPKRDPLQLSDEWRVAYVYAAQALLGLLALHLYLCRPDLFQLGVSWAYVSMALAFGGALLGHILERSGFPILGQPSVRVAMLLPMVSLAGHLASPDQSSLAVVCGTAAILFAVAAGVGRNWWCGAAAVVLGNATLWSFYHETELTSLLQNPQAWLVPPALSVLLVSQMYRNALGKSRLSAIRYAAAGVIYISSASELFIHGFGESLWPPIALASLSILGVLVGIGMRIRAFLYFGSSFLLTAIIAMVSHAGRAFGHVWPWWAFGITMGVAILLMFGLFEKHRDETRRLLRDLKSWDV